MDFEYLPGAQAELNEATAYYDRERPGLGLRFQAAVRASIRKIMEFPDAWPRIGRRVRRVRVKPFSYQLIYYVRGDRVTIVAVSHTSRRPGYWRYRLK